MRWERIADAAVRNGKSRTECYRAIIICSGVALAVGDRAKHLNEGTLKKLSKDFQILEGHAQALAKHYRERSKGQNEAVAQFYEGETDSSRWVGQLSDRALAEQCGHEARRFRQASAEIAGRLQVAGHQGGGSKRTAEHLAFMRSLTDSMRQDFGQPYYEAVAAIANIAYPTIKVKGEDVRDACKQRRRADARFFTRPEIGGLRAVLPEECFSDDEKIAFMKSGGGSRRIMVKLGDE
jgi:hypothetical protein